MARILVNYIYNKAKDEYKILDPNCVYADQKVAILETEADIRKPLVVPVNNSFTVVDRDAYEEKHRKFYLGADKEGNVFETPNGSEVWLPKDTDISKLRFINNQLVMVQDEPKPEEVKEEKPKKQAKAKN